MSKYQVLMVERPNESKSIKPDRALCLSFQNQKESFPKQQQLCMQMELECRRNNKTNASPIHMGNRILSNANSTETKLR